MAILKPVTGAGLTSTNKHAINDNFKNINNELSGSSTGSSTTTVVTSAQLKLLDTVPVTLVPAPGAGKTIRISSVRWDMVYKGIPYAGTTNMNISFANNLVMMQTMVNGLNLLQKKDDCFILSSLNQSMPLEENQSLVLNTFGGAPTLGNSDITVTVNYTLEEKGYTPAAINSIQFNNPTSLVWEPAPSFPPDQMYFISSVYPALLGGTRVGSSFVLKTDATVQNNAGVFKGATAIAVTSRNGGSIGTVTITATGYLSFNYTTPAVTGADYIDVVCVDEYGRAVSKSLFIDVAFDA